MVGEKGDGRCQLQRRTAVVRAGGLQPVAGSRNGQARGRHHDRDRWPAAIEPSLFTASIPTRSGHEARAQSHALRLTACRPVAIDRGPLGVGPGPLATPAQPLFGSPTWIRALIEPRAERWVAREPRLPIDEAQTVARLSRSTDRRRVSATTSEWAHSTGLSCGAEATDLFAAVAGDRQSLPEPQACSSSTRLWRALRKLTTTTRSSTQGRTRLGLCSSTSRRIPGRPCSMPTVILGDSGLTKPGDRMSQQANGLTAPGVVGGTARGYVRVRAARVNSSPPRRSRQP